MVDNNSKDDNKKKSSPHPLAGYNIIPYNVGDDSYVPDNHQKNDDDNTLYQSLYSSNNSDAAKASTKQKIKTKEENKEEEAQLEVTIKPKATPTEKPSTYIEPEFNHFAKKDDEETEKPQSLEIKPIPAIAESDNQQPKITTDKPVEIPQKAKTEDNQTPPPAGSSNNNNSLVFILVLLILIALIGYYMFNKGVSRNNDDLSSGRNIVASGDTDTNNSSAPQNLADTITSAINDNNIDSSSAPNPENNNFTWPNNFSSANSDRWLVRNHYNITKIQPRIMILHYDNLVSINEIEQIANEHIEVIKEATKPYGYSNADSEPFIEHQIAYIADLRDNNMNISKNNAISSYLPVKNMQSASNANSSWRIDFERLLSDNYLTSPQLAKSVDTEWQDSICNLAKKGDINELWLSMPMDSNGNNSGTTNNLMPAVLEYKRKYNNKLQYHQSEFNRCASGQCFDMADYIPCENSLRIVWIDSRFNQQKGCFIENYLYAFENMALSENNVAWLAPYAKELFNMQLNKDYGVTFENWLSCSAAYENNSADIQKCISYLSSNQIKYNLWDQSGTISNYDPKCGSVTMPLNANYLYDKNGKDNVATSCPYWRDASYRKISYQNSMKNQYEAIAPGCMGSWALWWAQNIPNVSSNAKDNLGQQMRNWWLFMYY